MGYFSNGTEGYEYEAQYCDRCVHNIEKFGCPVLELHRLYNYDECNNDDSILHKAIPRDDKGENERCVFFHLR